jgi:hypothetical protein
MCVTVRLPGRSAHLPTESLTKAANPMRTCSDTYLPTDVPTDFEKSGGIFKILLRNSKKIPTEFNATAQENIILSSIEKSVSKNAV